MNKFLYMKNVLTMSDHEIDLVNGLSKKKKKNDGVEYFIKIGKYSKKYRINIFSETKKTKLNLLKKIFKKIKYWISDSNTFIESY